MEFIDFGDDGKCCSVIDASEYMNIPEHTVIRWAIVTWCPFIIEDNIKIPYWPESFLKNYDSNPQKFICEMEDYVNNFSIPEYLSEIVFVVRRNKENTIILERYSENYWSKAKKIISKEDIIYITKDIRDSKLVEFNLETIIWKRFKDIDLDQYRKIIVPFTPDNIGLMEERAGQLWIEYYMEQLEREIARKRKQEKAAISKANYEEARRKIEAGYGILTLTDSPEDQNKALELWIQEGMKMPAPYIISDLKRNKYPDLSWKQFKEKMLNNKQ